ncbi:MAG: hypothetical protein ING71_17325 [Rhodocyclaceae bacterium]|nr:hypothetical protein [Rhodocyclaceae bacterium]
MAGLLIVPGIWPVFDANGDPVSGATISFYQPGTTTPKAVYSDATLTTSLGSVLTTNAAGEPTTLAGSIARLWWAGDGELYDIKATVNGLDRTWAGVKVGVDINRSRIWNVDDYGAVGNAAWNPIGGISGTDDGPLIQSLSDQLEALGGGILQFGARSYRSNQGLVQPKGVTWQGCGTPHHAYWQTGDSRKGTAIIVATPASGWSYTSEGTIEGGTVMRDMAVYDGGAAALSGLCRIPGKLHTQIENVEFGCLGRSAGVGFFCEKQGGALTIYATFINVRVLQTEHALDIEGDSNALTFVGCSFQGTKSSRRMRAESSLQPRAVAFINCSFERVFDLAVATPDIRFVATGSTERRQIVNYSGTSCYVTPFQQIGAAVSMSDYGCYYEDGGQTGANFNDGTNGAWPLLSIVDVSNATDCQSISFNNSDWVNTYLRDNGTATQASAYRGGTDYNQVARPCASQRKTTLQAIPTSTWTRVSLQAQIDSPRGQFEWESGSNQFRVLAGGNFAISGQVFFESMGVADYVQCRIVAGGKTFTGHNKNGTAGKPTGCTIAANLTLARGDTIALEAFQSSGASQDLNAYAENTFLSVAKI